MKTEYYLNNLTQYNNDELENIHNSKMYNRRARKAANQIMANRKDFQDQISSLDNEALKSVFCEAKKISCKYDFEVFLKEFAKRDIPIKIWFLKNKGTEDGPYTTNEVKNMVDREIDYHDTYLRRKDMKEWYPANWIKGLFKDNYMPQGKSNYLRTAGILIFISCALWLLVSLVQFNIAGAGTAAVFNFIAVVIWFAIGKGVFQKKEWAYRTGIVWASFTAIYNFIVAASNPMILILVLIEVLIIVFLYEGRRSVIAEKRVDLGFND
jgi:hypothetical protein